MKTLLDSQGVNLKHQYKSLDKYKSRFSIYKNTIDGRDMHQEVVEYVSSRFPHGVILDVGCGDGACLAALQDQTEAKLIAVDITERNLPAEIEFFKGSAQDLSFIPDQSVDCILALFMMYHVPDQDKALKEFQRILKPAGELIITTSGAGHAMRRNGFIHKITYLLDIPHVKPFTAAFDNIKALEMLPKYFAINKHVKQNSKVHIDLENLDKYMASINSYSPQLYERQWAEKADEVIKPNILKEIKLNGYFWEGVGRHMFVCSGAA